MSNVIYLSTNSIYKLVDMGVFGLDFVIELIPEEAAQTDNPFTILNPYHV